MEGVGIGLGLEVLHRLMATASRSWHVGADAPAPTDPGAYRAKRLTDTRVAVPPVPLPRLRRRVQRLGESQLCVVNCDEDGDERSSCPR